MGFGRAILGQELRGVRQFFGMGRDLGASMKALVERSTRACAWAYQRVCGRQRRHDRERAGRRLGLARGLIVRVSGHCAGWWWREERCRSLPDSRDDPGPPAHERVLKHMNQAS